MYWADSDGHATGALWYMFTIGCFSDDPHLKSLMHMKSRSHGYEVNTKMGKRFWNEQHSDGATELSPHVTFPPPPWASPALHTLWATVKTACAQCPTGRASGQLRL